MMRKLFVQLGECTVTRVDRMVSGRDLPDFDRFLLLALDITTNSLIRLDSNL